ncbi:MAG: prepilin peptidase [Clostridium sp.]|jgi:leader peptidase (prepilin peptidase)/N-methyltransferase|nr:prepilin peptidase [Clostridium sp.]
MWLIGGTILFLILLSVFDIQKRKMPVSLLLFGSICSLSCAVYFILDKQRTLAEHTAALVPGVLVLLLAFASRKIGYGDGWLLLILGLLLGQRDCMNVFLTSVFLAGCTGLVMLLFRKGKKTIPYVPFLAISVALLQIKK